MVREINPLDMVAAIETEPSFVVAFRGYRRRDVDHYAAVAEAQIAELVAERHELQTRLMGLAEQLHEAQTEVAELRHRPAIDETVSFRHLGHRAERILTEAEEQAASIRHEAVSAAREELLQLNRELVRARERNTREEAAHATRQKDAEHAVSRARDQARRLLTAAQEEAARVLQSSRHEADRVVAGARGKGQRAVVNPGWVERDAKPARTQEPAMAGAKDGAPAGKTASDTSEGKPGDAKKPDPGTDPKAEKKSTDAHPGSDQKAAKDATHLPTGAQADEALRRAHKHSPPAPPRSKPSTSAGPGNGRTDSP